ncbi:MAG: transporter substrate-binding domain-containing protein [Bacilli bacterium]
MFHSKMALLFAVAVCGFSAVSCSKNSEDSIRIGMECDYAPFNWTEAKENENNLAISNADGYADGYDIQVAKVIGEKLGKKVKIVKEKWESLVPDADSGLIDLVLAGMTNTEERAKTIDFSEEYYHSEVVLLTSSAMAESVSGKVLGKEDLTSLLSGKNVISQKDTIEDDIAANFATEFGAVHVTPQTTYTLAANDVSLGIAAALVVEKPVAKAYVSSLKNVGIVSLDQSVLGVELSSLGVSIGMKKGNTALKDSVNEALATLSTEKREEMMLAAVERSSSN